MELFQEELITLWDVVCPKCNSEILNKNGKYRNRQRFTCLDCGFTFTTYSKTILDSTKLNSDQWRTIIDGILEYKKLKSIAEEIDVSIATVSKIRKKCLQVLYKINTFKETLKQYYYNPFDTTSIFTKHQEQGNLYSLPYNNNTYITYMHNKSGFLTSNVYSKSEYNKLLTNIHYKSLSSIPYDEIQDDAIIQHIDELTYFLKKYRGVKSNDLVYYTTLFDTLAQHSKRHIKSFLIKQIHLTTKNDLQT